eukprot:172634_1
MTLRRHNDMMVADQNGNVANECLLNQTHSYSESSVQIGDIRDREGCKLLQSSTNTRIPESKASAGESSSFGAICNLTNTVVGAGIIGIPFAIDRAGFVLGVISLIVMGIATEFTLNLIVVTGLRAGEKDYENLCRRLFGPFGAHSINFSQAFCSCSFTLSYTMICGDMLSKLCADIGVGGVWEERWLWIVLVATCLMLPVSLLKDLARLEKASVLSILCLSFIIVSVLARGPVVGISPSTVTNPYSLAKITFFSAMGTIGLAFTAHNFAFPIYLSLKDRSQSNWRRVSRWGIGLAVGTISLVGIVGYLSYFDTTKANILQNFPPGDMTMRCARIAFSLMLVLTYPLYNHNVRYILENSIIRPNFGDNVVQNPVTRISITVSIWALITFIGLVVDDLGVVFEVVGSTSVTYMSFIMPTACYFKQIHMENQQKSDMAGGIQSEDEKGIAWWTHFVICALIFVFGIAVFFCGTIFAFYD